MTNPANSPYVAVRNQAMALSPDLRRMLLQELELDMTTHNVSVSASAGASIDSTSDARVVNNVMRHEYRVLDDAEKANMKAIKDKGLEFWQLVGRLGHTRELSLAQTKIEEAVMWAVKHITK